MKRLIALFFLVFVLSACTQIKDPSIEGVDNVNIIKMDSKLVDMKADMIIHNPNPFALDLESAKLTASVDDIQIATIDQTYETSMPANSNFEMPVRITMDIEKLYADNPMKALSKGLEIIADRKLEVKFQGTINAGKGIAKVNVSVDQMEIVDF